MLEISETPAHATWFATLRDRVAKARIDIRIRRLSLGDPGDDFYMASRPAVGPHNLSSPSPLPGRPSLPVANTADEGVAPYGQS